MNTNLGIFSVFETLALNSCIHSVVIPTINMQTYNRSIQAIYCTLRSRRCWDTFGRVGKGIGKA